MMSATAEKNIVSAKYYYSQRFFYTFSSAC